MVTDSNGNNGAEKRRARTWNGSMYRSGAPVTLVMRSPTTLVSGCASHSFCEHQHWYDLRTGESWSPASERSKCASHEEVKASASSSEMKFSSVITHGASNPNLGWLGCERALGLYCWKSVRMRVIVALMSPARTAGGVFGGRLHDSRFDSHALHETAQFSSM